MTTDQHGHRHGRTCYWDHLRCGWVCTDPPAEPVVDVDAGLDRAVDAVPAVAAGDVTAPRVPPEPLPA